MDTTPVFPTQTDANKRTLQEVVHGSDFDYEAGSPHLRHNSLRGRLIAELRTVIGDLMASSGHCQVLEIGAGHGTFTDTVAALGADVTITEMSEPVASLLTDRYRNNSRVSVLFDRDGEMALRAGQTYDAVLMLSVLHHIPDYRSYIRRMLPHISPGGSFVSWQDPLNYDRRGRLNMSLDRGSYLLWRLGQGEFRRGAATRIRRIRGEYLQDNASDMVEYHVVRSGVDELGVAEQLRCNFEHVRMVRYWSTQSPVLQYVGDVFGLRSTFGLVATDRLPRESKAAPASSPSPPLRAGPVPG